MIKHAAPDIIRGVFLKCFAFDVVHHMKGKTQHSKFRFVMVRSQSDSD